MGEFEVHRARLFAFVPAGVRCLAGGDPRPATPARPPLLALGRLDGAVELYDLQANSFLEKVIPGHETRIPEALCWAGEDRLFGAGLSGEIVEYDLEKLHVKYSLDAFGGPIWSMAPDPTGTQLAVGCEDGSVKLFLVLPDRIQFERQLDRQKGHSVQRIKVERRLQGPRNQKCVVWGLAFLSDGTVVSADSAGKVQFWDSKMGTLLSKHPVSKAAALCIAVSEAEDSLVVGTSEGMVYQFQRLPVRLGSAEHQWVRTRPFQFHTHDVRAVVHTATAFISGGLDGQLVIRPLMDKVESKTYEASLRKITFPHRCLVSCARKARLLLFQHPQHLDLWRLGATDATGEAGEILPLSSPPEHLLQLKAKGPEHISASCVSPCGTWIAYSTASRFYLHRLQYNGEPDCHQEETKEAVYLLAVSADGRWLAAASGDRAINIYNVKGGKFHCTVPSYDCPVTALAIHPGTNDLVVAHSDQQVFEFSIIEKEYTPWSRKVHQLGLHRDWLQRDTPITHIAFHPKQASYILLHDTYMFCILDKSLPLPEDTAVLHNQISLAQLSKAARRAYSHAFKICKKYQPLLFVDLLDERSLVVVERSVADIKAQLPPPVYQKKFGT
ncbi:hypothetical protein JRQ81_006554 [Phrynocephalus forsythii]|uniref:Cirhin n=1 Tax=Phrynocephalus forsythii TaxID=171643 RepID=A0A9Q0XI62_9SAUR|nr:hypothetical protein JRQ81_006554 [Phrynocephalus forsythii]